jgi:hypothetical protein
VEDIVGTTGTTGTTVAQPASAADTHAGTTTGTNVGHPASAADTHAGTTTGTNVGHPASAADTHAGTTTGTNVGHPASAADTHAGTTTGTTVGHPVGISAAELEELRAFRAAAAAAREAAPPECPRRKRARENPLFSGPCLAALLAANDRSSLSLFASALSWDFVAPVPPPLRLVLLDPSLLHTNGLQTAGVELATEVRKRFPFMYQKLIVENAVLETRLERELAAHCLSSFIFRASRLLFFTLLSTRWYMEDPLKKPPVKTELDALLHQVGLNHFSTEKK